MLRYSAGLLLLGATFVNGDSYLQNPKGCNNRLNEKSANRNNANRLFDSQNNNRGGYNAADLDDNNGASANNPEASFQQMYEPDANLGNRQYNMVYIEGSMMHGEWTNQHGCGNQVNNCNLVLQMGCDTESYENTNFNSYANKGMGTRMIIRNGGNTNAPDDPGNNVNNIDNTFNANNGNDRGRHESEEFYNYCRNRGREEGLFTADQKVKGNNQINTRQNPNGNRSGLECPEERDYYPWPYPSPWIDMMWSGNDVEYCKTNIAPYSQRVHPKGTCTGGNANQIPNNDQVQTNNAADCAAAGGTWVTTTPTEQFTPEFADALCQEQSYSQANHLGNADGTGKGGQMDGADMWLPTVAQMESWGCHVYNENINGQQVQLVASTMRLRYNISTMDYDPYTTDSTFNNDPENGVISPVQQNPTVDVGAYMQGLQLAINTAQTGRTFQDRTHKMYIMKNPATPNTGNLQTAEMNVVNLNVRGKRGNIVQTFPAVEYDFVPSDFVLVQGQCMHMQWAGSNTHNNGNPAGDGQAGDAGEGRGGSDRSNIAEMQSMRQSYPMTYDLHESFFDTATCKYPMADQWLTPTGAKVALMTAGYYPNEAAANAGDGQNNGNVDALLNNVSGAMRQGLVCCPQGPGGPNGETPVGDYYFLSTRNNNFSNRAQKMKVKVIAATDPAANPGTPEAFTFFPTENVQLMNKKYPDPARRRRRAQARA